MTLTLMQGVDFAVDRGELSWRLPGLDKLADAGAIRDDQYHEAPAVERILGPDRTKAALANPFGSREFVTTLGSPRATVPASSQPRSPLSPAAPSPKLASPVAQPAARPPPSTADLYARRQEAAKLMERVRYGDATASQRQSAANVAAADVRADPSTARTMGEFSAMFWTRYRNRQAAGLCPFNGTAKADAQRCRPAAPAKASAPSLDRDAIFSRMALAENRLPDPADIYARRRRSAA